MPCSEDVASAGDCHLWLEHVAAVDLLADRLRGANQVLLIFCGALSVADVLLRLLRAVAQSRSLSKVTLLHSCHGLGSLIRVVAAEVVLAACVFLENRSAMHVAPVQDLLRLAVSVLPRSTPVVVRDGLVGAQLVDSLSLRWCGHRVVRQLDEVLEEALMVLTLITNSPKFFLIIDRGGSTSLCFGYMLLILSRTLPYLILRLVPLRNVILVTAIASDSHDRSRVTTTTSCSVFAKRILKFICVRWLN